jgi:hypothetical protein
MPKANAASLAKPALAVGLLFAQGRPKIAPPPVFRQRREIRWLQSSSGYSHGAFIGAQNATSHSTRTALSGVAQFLF